MSIKEKAVKFFAWIKSYFDLTNKWQHLHEYDPFAEIELKKIKPLVFHRTFGCAIKQKTLCKYCNNHFFYNKNPKGCYKYQLYCTICRAKRKYIEDGNKTYYIYGDE